MTLPTPLVSTEWLRDHLDMLTVKLIDASWRLPGGADPARAAYKEKHIPGAMFFDIDAIADTSTNLPHMLPTPDVFETAVSAMGVSNDDAVIVYDEQGLFSAARVWWTFQAMGHKQVAVLDGGLPKWVAEGGAVSDRTETPKPAVFKASLQPTLIANHNAIRKRGADTLVLDARPAARFNGEAPEPRNGLVNGAMPNARNTPSSDLITKDGTLKSVDEIREIFAAAGFDKNPVITTCGSGVTAAALALALTQIGHNDWRLYDGSWAEWGQESNDKNLFPVVAQKRDA